MSRLSGALTLFLGMAVLGCDDLEAGTEAPPAGDLAPIGATTDGGVPTSEQVRTAVIDASRKGAWVYLDLDTGAQATDAALLGGWDLALSRFDVKLNGGVSDTGEVQAAVLPSARFDALTGAPTAGWDSDRADGADDDARPDYLASSRETGWWDYDGASHKLTPRAHVYVIRSDAGSFYKLVVRSYSNRADSSGHPELAWAKITPPAGPLTPRDASAVDVTTRASEAAYDAGGAAGGGS